MTFAKSFAAAFISLGAAGASAQVVEWRLIGPSASWHADQKTGRVITPAHNDANGDVIPTERGWSQSNPSLGVERAEVYTDHTDKIFASVVRDSFSRRSFMLGAAQTYPIFRAGTFSVEAGAAAGVWERSFSNGEVVTGYVFDRQQQATAVTRTVLVRKVVPFLLPVLAATESKTGLGVNVAFMPLLKVNGKLLVPTNTVMAQITYKLKF
jgi:hypothetical protein